MSKRTEPDPRSGAALRGLSAAGRKPQEETEQDGFNVPEENPMRRPRRCKRLSNTQIGRIIAEAAKVGRHIAEIEVDAAGTTRLRFAGAVDSSPDLYEEWAARL